MNYHLRTITESIECQEQLLEADHALICSPGEISAATLQELGLYSSPTPIQHAAHGTASRLIFFENAYLEIIWITDPFVAARSAIATGVDILSRVHWQQTQASPFGIGLRVQQLLPTSQNSCTTRRRPRSAAGWIDKASPYLAPNNLAHPVEPLCCLVPPQITVAHLLNVTDDSHRHLINHPLGMRRLTGITIATQTPCQSPQLGSILSAAQITVEATTYPRLELTCDSGRQGKTLNAHPILPLLLHY